MDNNQPEKTTSSFNIRNQNTLFIVLCVVFYGVELALCFLTPDNVGAEIVGLVGLFFIPLGWRTLNMITPNIFLFLPLIGWLIYFFIKFFGAFFVGLVVGPKWCAKGLAELFHK